MTETNTQNIIIGDIEITGTVYLDNNYVMYFTVTEKSESDNHIILSGNVNRDGCINWETNSEVMYHCCAERDINNISVYLHTVRHLGRVMMPTTIY